ncbi:exodeoxyribonuclease VII large subunit [Phototrophicus methaneseepsis]|uniref:Exodeoxyribonuclease 7 large subunit n=1 Tax=Phototrophicus methaneseepsis TaxID=2710758 RepID=A0A7S8IEU0_9CHLR|nr:exodeoxyribonuclease VII large subunit [Phototrophicus methaneseepsis]QPC82168.1 exodeoxyribonuclease VII large subunit [Phototrophicus methaneseepsis]
MDSTAYSITGVTAYIRNLLESDDLLADVWVTGEVSNYRPAASGHWYFTVKDDNAQLKCVMFRSAAVRQSIEMREGDAVNVHGRISVYDARGEYQLYADMIQPAGGVGSLYEQFERIKAKLLAEGLFDEARKRPLPAFPRKIGVVTSPDAAAFQDVQNVLRRRYPLAEVVLSPTLVQGVEAPPMIVRAIERLQQTDIDVLLICRGGGSIEDLWAFNDERVARALADSRVPTVSGVGHETDFTIVDFVTDRRAPTPSAAAEISTPNVADLYYDLMQTDLLLARLLQDRIALARQTLITQERRLEMASPQRSVRMARQQLDDLYERLHSAQGRYFSRLQERLQARQQALQAANPDAILARGYAIVTRSEDGARIRSIKDASQGSGVMIRLKDGTLAARIEDEETHGQYKRTLL